MSRIGIVALIALATGLIVFCKVLYANEISRGRVEAQADQADEYPEDWHDIWRRTTTMTLPGELNEAMLLETRPIRRPHQRDSTTKYLAYRPHSGFHNQVS